MRFSDFTDVEIIFGRLGLVRDVRLGKHERAARDSDYPLIRSATHRRRQIASSFDGDIRADDGKVPARQFQNVRTAKQRIRSRVAGVRVRAESAEKHDLLLFGCHEITIGELPPKCKNKIPAIAGLVSAFDSTILPHCGSTSRAS